MSVSRRSAIWNVFTETYKSDFIATCNICSQEFSYRSTTTNLMKHLKRKHPTVSLDLNSTTENSNQVIVIERQLDLDNDCEVNSFKVELKAASSEESTNYVVLEAGKKVLPVWTFFSKLSNSDYLAACTYCFEEISFQFGNTNELIKHLEMKHFDILTNITIEGDDNSALKYTELDIVPKKNSHSESITQNVCDFKEVANNEHAYHKVIDTQIISNPESSSKIVEKCESPLNNSGSVVDDFWTVQDNSDDDPEFRPTPSPVEEESDKAAASSRKRSHIWNVFTEKPDAEYVAVCNVCNQDFCYRSTTNNLKKHFQRKHPNINLDQKIEPSIKSEMCEFTDKFDNRNSKDSSDDEQDDSKKLLVEKPGKRKPSQLWNYFTKKKQRPYVAICNICKKELGYRSTTSNLKKHLERKHPDIGLVKMEVEENKKEIGVPLKTLKTCLICLENDANESKVFQLVNQCDSEEKSLMEKIQEILNQQIVIDESHVVCQLCVSDIEKVLQFKDKMIKAFEFWSKIEPEPEPEPESDTAFDAGADDFKNSDYSDLEDGESLAQFTCTKCQKVFPSSSIMLKHTCGESRKIKSETNGKVNSDNKFYCEHCGKGFLIKWKLTKHIKKCQSYIPKQFTCSMCDRVFKKAYHLREHMASHTGERNYSCNICGKTFQRSSSKHKHMRSHNAKPGEKSKKTPFLCTICGKSFPYSNGASRHMRVHLGERRHECHICLKKFSQTTHLKVHLRTHSGERPYGCMICGRTFSLNASLRKHMRLHVGAGEFGKLVKNLGTNLETNMETNLGSIETNIPEALEDNLGENIEHIDNDLGANITHVTDDGIPVLSHHDISIQGNH